MARLWERRGTDGGVLVPGQTAQIDRNTQRILQLEQEIDNLESTIHERCVSSDCSLRILLVTCPWLRSNSIRATSRKGQGGGDGKEGDKYANMDSDEDDFYDRTAQAANKR